MNQQDWAQLRANVKEAEGFRKKAYQDSVGVWTIGYGTNLQELKIDEPLAAKWLESKLIEAQSECEHAWPWFNELSPTRQRALIELVYNMGMPRFSKFSRTIAHLSENRFIEASVELANSKWAQQVGSKRSNRIIEMIRDDSAPTI